MTDPKQIAEEVSNHTIQAIAIAEKEGNLNSQEDLRLIVSAAIETGIEEYIESQK
jgi:hypothetical protein